ncbi:unnamed protein product, partial [Ectocarpus sp. 8 AP-2014]
TSVWSKRAPRTRNTSTSSRALTCPDHKTDVLPLAKEFGLLRSIDGETIEYATTHTTTAAERTHTAVPLQAVYKYIAASQNLSLGELFSRQRAPCHKTTRS